MRRAVDLNNPWLQAVCAGIPLAVALVLAAPAEALVVTPASPTVTSGQDFSVTLTDDVVNDDIAALEFDIDFDPTVLSLTGVTFGADLIADGFTGGFGPATSPAAPYTAGETVSAFTSSLNDVFSTGATVLATLQFAALPVTFTGTTPTSVLLDTSPYDLGFPDSGQPVFSQPFDVKVTDVPASTGGGGSSVPAPGVVCLAGAAAALLAARRRRR